MNLSELSHRDRVLRAYFEGRDWDRNSEYTLKRQLVLNSTQLLPNYPYIIEDEWEVESSRTDKGRGDLVFADGAGGFAVVEVKWLDLEITERNGPTKRTSNRKKWRAVEEQAITYADNYVQIAHKAFDSVKHVEAFIFTNELDKPQLLGIIDPLTDS